MKTTSLYDFTLTANGTFVILADANFYKVLTSTGDIQVTRDGGATIKPLRAGRGERNVQFQRLIIKDISGAPNSGTILVGDSDFIDDTIVLSSAINVRPEQYSTALAPVNIGATGATQIIAPASNTGGMILQLLNAYVYASYGGQGNFLAKSSAPASASDGDGIFALKLDIAGSANYFSANLSQPVLIPAGKGLYHYGMAGNVYGSGCWAMVQAKFL